MSSQCSIVFATEYTQVAVLAKSGRLNSELCSQLTHSSGFSSMTAPLNYRSNPDSFWQELTQCSVYIMWSRIAGFHAMHGKLFLFVNQRDKSQIEYLVEQYHSLCEMCEGYGSFYGLPSCLQEEWMAYHQLLEELFDINGLNHIEHAHNGKQWCIDVRKFIKGDMQADRQLSWEFDVNMEALYG